MDQSSRLNEYAKELIRYKARRLIGKYGLTEDDFEDLIQEMMLDLYQRLPKYKAERAGLNTFIARVVENKISSIIRFRRQEKRDPRAEAYSLDERVEDPDGASDLPKQPVSQDEHDLRTGRFDRPGSERLDLSLDLARVLSGLPPDLRRIAEGLMTHSLAQVARDLGIARSTLYDHEIERLRALFKDRSLDDYL